MKKLRDSLNIFLTGEVGRNNSLNREIWLEKTLLNLPVGHKILDAGAGESRYKKYCNHLIYLSQDFAEYDGSGDSKGIQKSSRNYSNLDIISDITEIPVENESFDAVMCIEVIEHVPDSVKALNELCRVLKPGGYLILTAPFASLTHYSPFHFATGFNIYYYQHHLSNLGLDILESTHNGNYFEFIAQELRRLNQVASEYTDMKLNFIGKIGLNLILFFLNRFSKNDSVSHELLNFGYNIFAQKK